MPVTKKQPKRKRLKRGRDWHAWVRKSDLGNLDYHTFFRRYPELLEDGDKYVRIKFVEVKT